MEQEDYLKRQIDQFGQVLGKILADLTGLKTTGLISEGIEAVDKELKKELGLNIDDLCSIPINNFINMLKEGNKLSNDNFEKLADILLLLAGEPDPSKTDNDKKNKLYERSLAIYEHLDRTTTTYSFDRHSKIERIKNAL